MLRGRHRSSQARSGRKIGWRVRLLAPIAALGLLLGVLPATPAFSAASAALTVRTTITDTSDAVITSVDSTGSSPTNVSVFYRVHVAYSCSLSDCTDVAVTLAGTQLDPTYNLYHRETGTYVFNPPFTPQPAISGSVYNGLTVELGTVTAGTSGSFSIDYQINNGSRGNPAGGSFFANGSTIRPKATITASDADTVSDSTASASWVSTVPDPILDLSSMGGSVRTDTPYTVDFGPRTTSGCVVYTGLYGTLYTYPSRLCAKSYSLTVSLPENAQYVDGSGGSAPTPRTVILQNSGSTAAIGPYSARPSYPNDSAFKVTFPSADYPTSGAGCVVNVTFDVTFDVTYLDGTQKSVQGTRDVQVQNCTPFAKATITKWSATSSNVRTNNFNIPSTPGAVDNTGSWRMEVDNQSNVAGVATMSDTFDQPDLGVYRLTVAAGGPATVNYTLSNGTTGSQVVANGGTINSPAGLYYASMNASSSPLAGPNPQSTGNGVTPFQISAYFALRNGATPGTRTNTVTGSVTYPDYPELSAVDVGPISHTLTLRDPTNVQFAAGNPVATVTGGGTALVGSEVTWTQNAQLDNLPVGSLIVPQYVFLAPKGWTIASNGASLATAVPGATFAYRSVSYGGDTYDAVIVNWPAATGQVGTANLPALRVKTSPTGAAPAGTNNQTARIFVGDVDNSVVPVYTPTAYVDVTDLDADDSSADGFAVATGVTSLAPSRAVSVTKEICRPDVLASDGCNWISNSSVIVGVPPAATSIKYRVTIRNIGNVALSDIVAYDVLPFLNDTGTSDATASTSRGSSVQETLSGVSNVDPNVTLAYSASTNPPRPEVYTGATNGDWTNPLVGASAIQAKVSTLAAQGAVTFGYQAALVGASADTIACNSVAVKASLLTAIEPAAVCATTQEADLRITAPPHLPLQGGRAGVATFTVINGGSSASGSGTVKLAVPSGLTVTSLSVAGWDCTAPSMTGPVEVGCTPVNADGSTRSLAQNVPDAITLPIRPDADLAADSICVNATVLGLMFDPDMANNDASSCSKVFQGTKLLAVEKTDGQTRVGLDDTLTYTLTASNLIVGQGVTGAVLSDALPSTVAFISASDGATVSGTDGDGNGGTVTWPAVELAAAGTLSGAGDSVGALGSSVQRTVTVRIVEDAAAGDLVNTASLSASDPADPSAALQVSGSDTDTIVVPVPTITKRIDSATDTGGIWTLKYEIQVTNPNASWPTRYTLDDAFAFAPDASVIGIATVTSADTVVSPSWDGVSDLAIVPTAVGLAAGETHLFTITVRIDPGATEPGSAPADCQVDQGETGTGLRSIATLVSGATTVSADACEALTVASDPGTAPSGVGGLATTGLALNPLLVPAALLLVLLGLAVAIVARRRRHG